MASGLSLCLLAMLAISVSTARIPIGHVTFGPLTEEQEAGVLVGDLSDVLLDIVDDMTEEERDDLSYNFLLPHADPQSFRFSINRHTGKLYTVQVIDRDSVCPAVVDEDGGCLLRFNATVTAGAFGGILMGLIHVAVNVTDINDNVPTFSSREVTLEVPESVPTGVAYPLPMARDDDLGENSIAGYDLATDTEDFSLDVLRNLDGTLGVSLVVNTHPDRQKQDEHTLLVTARDGGSPPFTGSLTVKVKVTEDQPGQGSPGPYVNGLKFDRESYTFRVPEDFPEYTVIGNVSATDSVTGSNKEIQYFLTKSQGCDHLSRFVTLFKVSGRIRVREPLQAASGQTLGCIVEARGGRNHWRVAQARLEIAITDTSNDPPRPEFSARFWHHDKQSLMFPENSEVPMLLGVLKVEDNDPGINGSYQCRSQNDDVEIVQLEPGRPRLVMLRNPLDREEAGSLNVTLTCTDAGTPPLTSLSTFFVKVTDVNDNTPVFSSQTYRAVLLEKAEKGTEVIQVSAHDRDDDYRGQFYYHIHPRDLETFTVDSVTGMLYSNVQFDRDVVSEVTVLVVAVDEGSQALTGTATIVVTIVDENYYAPYLPEDMELSVETGSRKGDVVGQLKALHRELGLVVRFQSEIGSENGSKSKNGSETGLDGVSDIGSENGSVSSQVVFVQRQGNSTPPFSVDEDGVVRVSGGSELDMDSEYQYEMVVVVSYKHRPLSSSTATVTIYVTPSSTAVSLTSLPALVWLLTLTFAIGIFNVP